MLLVALHNVIKIIVVFGPIEKEVPCFKHIGLVANKIIFFELIVKIIHTQFRNS